ncbi:cadmium resistance transporter [Kitasatospora sp. NPDC058965]|uniref:cadmium resistance transporter n=1 Tax=Kitasatospora sp. NPDC058965 TaxID=3346682 RepID=UPI00368E45ED
MADLLVTAAAAVGTFAGTNVDDLAVLAVLFVASRATGKPTRRAIWLGQAAGFTVLVLASLAIALGLAVVPGHWVGLLGLLPLALGARGLVRAVRGAGPDGRPAAVPATGPVALMLLTVTNGADNLAVYPPVFRTVGSGQLLVTVAVFAAGVVTWCLLGSWLGSHRAVVGVLERRGPWIVPGVFVLLGLVILLGSGVLTA